MIVTSNAIEKGKKTYTAISKLGTVDLTISNNKLTIVRDSVTIAQFSLCDLYDLAVESISEADSKSSAGIARRKIEVGIVKQARLLLNL